MRIATLAPILTAASEAGEPILNLLLIGVGLGAYWLGVGLRAALAEPGRRRFLAHAVLAFPLSFIVVPLLLFAVSASSRLWPFAAAWAASFLAGFLLNKAAVSHLTRRGLGL